MRITVKALHIASIIAIIFISAPVAAKKYKTIQYSNGTGFFVSSKGHLVTNAHVVDKCKWAQISGSNMVSRARIVAKDKKNDMALLLSKMTPSAIATFRPESSLLKKDDKIVIVGHPLGKGLTTKTGKLLDDKGPLGEPQWLQFSNIIFKGNSGGPLLDASGYVIGMIMAKSTLYRYDPVSKKSEPVGNSDIAIRNNVLADFLKKHRIQMKYGYINQRKLSDKNIENSVKDYIVHIKCIVSS